MATYEREAEYLLAAYRRAVGLCLQYGIKVYRPGGGERSLGEMREDVFVHRMRYGLDPEGQPVDYATVKSYRRYLKDSSLIAHEVDYFKQPLVGYHAYNPAHVVFYTDPAYRARFERELAHLNTAPMSSYLDLARQIKEIP